MDYYTYINRPRWRDSPARLANGFSPARTVPAAVGAGRRPPTGNRLFGTAPFALNVSRTVGSQNFSTSTAALACVIACCGTSQLTDFRFERTGHYLSSRNQWFLAGERSACSHWDRRAVDGSRLPGDGIELVSEDLARRLLELHGGPAEAFFECEEG